MHYGQLYLYYGLMIGAGNGKRYQTIDRSISGNSMELRKK